MFQIIKPIAKTNSKASTAPNLLGRLDCTSPNTGVGLAPARWAKTNKVSVSRVCSKARTKERLRSRSLSEEIAISVSRVATTPWPREMTRP